MNTQIATKFVEWDIKPLENDKKEFPYQMREKLNNGKELTREEKNALVKQFKSGTAFIYLHGYCYGFYDVCKLFYVEQWGNIYKMYGFDKTSIRANCFGKITRIIEVK